MPAADDLLVAPSCVEDAHSVGRLSDANPDITAWLHWLAELLPAARCIALVRVNSSGVPVAVSRNPGSPVLPEVAMVLASRACCQRSRQWLQTQSTLVGLASWAMRSLDWAERPNAMPEPGLCNTCAMVEPNSIQELLDQLSLRY